MAEPITQVIRFQEFLDFRKFQAASIYATGWEVDFQAQSYIDAANASVAVPQGKVEGLIVLIMDPTPIPGSLKYNVRGYLETRVLEEGNIKQLRVLHVGTNPANLRQGCARQAYTSVLSAARAEGCTRCVAPIGDRNEKSIALHKKLGFAIGKENADAKSKDYYLDF